MKVTSTRVYQNRVKAPKGYKFDKSRVENNPMLFDEDEIKTVQLKYDDRVITWLSTLDMAILTEEDTEAVFSSYLVENVEG